MESATVLLALRSYTQRDVSQIASCKCLHWICRFVVDWFFVVLSLPYVRSAIRMPRDGRICGTKVTGA